MRSYKVEMARLEKSLRIKRNIKSQVRKGREIDELTLKQLKAKEHLLPKTLFHFSLQRSHRNPYSLLLLKYYQLHLRRLVIATKTKSKSLEEAVDTYFDRLPVRTGALELTKAYLDLSGRKGEYVRPRIRKELILRIEQAESKLLPLIHKAKRRHAHSKKCLEKIKLPIEKDIITVLAASLGQFDTISNVETKSYDANWTIDNTKGALSSLYSRVELEEALLPSSFLFTNNMIEINFQDLSGNAWGEVDISLSQSFQTQYDPKCRRFEKKIGSVYEYIEPKVTIKDVILPETVKNDVLALCDHYRVREKAAKKPGLTFLFAGPPGTGKTFSAQAIAGELGKQLLKVSFSEISSRATSKIIAYFIARAKASNAILLFDECEDMVSYNPFIGLSDGWIKTAFENFEGVAVFTTNYGVPKGFDRRMTYVVDFKNPTPKLREHILMNEFKSLKESGVINKVPEKSLTSSLAKDFSIPGGYYKATLQLALAKSFDSKKDSNGIELVDNAIETAFKTMQERVGNERNDSVREPRIQLVDIKLDSDVETQVARFIGYAKQLSSEIQSPLLPKGTTALFSGPPGTGKTITAEAIAQELGVDFRRVSPSTFMSPWFGETEANVRRIFKDAERERYLLFVDEAEGMLGDRQGDGGAIRHTIINEFLQQIESFSGVLIVATNFSKMMDVAFGRRFLFHMAFSLPCIGTRLALWKEWKKELKLEDSVLQGLAKSFELSGGEIRNVAIKARVNGQRTFAELSELCEKVFSERTGHIKRRIGIQGVRNQETDLEIGNE